MYMDRHLVPGGARGGRRRLEPGLVLGLHVEARTTLALRYPTHVAAATVRATPRPVKSNLHQIKVNS